LACDEKTLAEVTCLILDYFVLERVLDTFRNHFEIQAVSHSDDGPDHLARPALAGIRVFAMHVLIGSNRQLLEAPGRRTHSAAV